MLASHPLGAAFRRSADCVRAVVYDNYGPRDVLAVAAVGRPVAGYVNTRSDVVLTVDSGRAR